MVDRYSLTTPAKNISDRFSVEVPDFYKPRYNAAPTQLLPVITNSGKEGLSWFYWGRPPQFARDKNLSEKIINLSVETLQDKPVLKKTFIQHRCILPADGFYGWKKVGKKTSIPYRFTVRDQEVFSLAGVWEEFEDEGGELVHTFTMMTTPANQLVATIMERMPVILNKEEEEIWLSSSRETAIFDTLKTYPAAKMDLYTVSAGIADPKNDFPSIILPAPAADQHGNLTLFD